MLRLIRATRNIDNLFGYNVKTEEIEQEEIKKETKTKTKNVCASPKVSKSSKKTKTKKSKTPQKESKSSKLPKVPKDSKVSKVSKLSTEVTTKTSQSTEVANTESIVVTVTNTENAKDIQPTIVTTTTTTNGEEQEEFDPYSFCDLPEYQSCNFLSEFVIDITATTRSNNSNEEVSLNMIDQINNNYNVQLKQEEEREGERKEGEEDAKYQDVEIKVQRHHILNVGKSKRQMYYKKKSNNREIVFTPQILSQTQAQAAKQLQIGTSTCGRLFRKALTSIPCLAESLSSRKPNANIWPSRDLSMCPFFKYAADNNGIRFLKRIYKNRASNTI